jgi:porin
VNNGPVFGIPGTQVGSVWESTQLTGDWNGLRTDLARQGFFFDVYTTSGYQDVTSGGLKTGSAFFENTQISMNIDTARAGLWSGGIIHFTAQARSGDTPEDTFTVGASVPHYYGLLLPGPELSHDIYPSDYYLVQALSKEFSVVLGTISGLFLPDQTLFGDSYKYYFTNFSFNKNPMFTNFYQPTAIAALGVFVPTKWLAITGGVLDPYSKANDFGDVFKAVNLYVAPIFSYNIAGLPGQFSPAFNWSNQPHTDLSQPFGPFTSPTQIPQAVGNLLGSPRAKA